MTTRRPAKAHARFILPLLISFIGFGMIWCGFAPGLMIYDSIRQYGQALSGQFDDWHPAAMHWLWREIMLHITPQTGAAPMLLLQLALYWLGAGLVSAWLLGRTRPRIRRWVSLACLCATLFAPLPLYIMGMIVKDSLMAACLLCTTGLLLHGKRPAGTQRRNILNRAAQALALPLMLYAATLRFNAFTAILPLSVLFFSKPPKLPLALTYASAALALLLLAAPMANRLIGAKPSGVGLSLIIYDLAGVSAYSHTNAFPPLALQDVQAINTTCYNHTSWDAYAWWPPEPCPIQFADIKASFDAHHLSPVRFWLAQIAHHPWAYAQHRLAHFNSNTAFLVRHDSAAALNLENDPNAWGFTLGANALRTGLWRWGELERHTVFGWPCFWIALAMSVALIARHSKRRATILPLALSSLCYGGGYLMFSVATETRYHLWTMLSAGIALALLVQSWNAGEKMKLGHLLLCLSPVALVVVLAITARVGLLI
jgi:hypothetical protein